MKVFDDYGVVNERVCTAVRSLHSHTGYTHISKSSTFLFVLCTSSFIYIICSIGLPTNLLSSGTSIYRIWSESFFVSTFSYSSLRFLVELSIRGLESISTNGMP